MAKANAVDDLGKFDGALQKTGRLPISRPMTTQLMIVAIQ